MSAEEATPLPHINNTDHFEKVRRHDKARRSSYRVTWTRRRAYEEAGARSSERGVPRRDEEPFSGVFDDNGMGVGRVVRNALNEAVKRASQTARFVGRAHR